MFCKFIVHVGGLLGTPTSSTTSSAQTPQFSPLSSDISLLANEDTVEVGILTSQSNLHSTTEGMESCGKNICR